MLTPAFSANLFPLMCWATVVSCTVVRLLNSCHRDACAAVRVPNKFRFFLPKGIFQRNAIHTNCHNFIWGLSEPLHGDTKFLGYTRKTWHQGISVRKGLQLRSSTCRILLLSCHVGCFTLSYACGMPGDAPSDSVRLCTRVADQPIRPPINAASGVNAPLTCCLIAKAAHVANAAR